MTEHKRGEFRVPCGACVHCMVFDSEDPACNLDLKKGGSGNAKPAASKEEK